VRYLGETGAGIVPGDAFDEAWAEVVEGDGDLHGGVEGVAGVGAEEHDLVVVGEVVVGDGDGGGAFDDVDEAVGGVGEEVVVDPDVGAAEDGDGVAVRDAAVASVVRGAAHGGGAGALAVVDVDAVDDDVAHELRRDAGAARDVHVGAAPVERLVAVHEELLLELDVHVAREHDPQRLALDDPEPQRPGRRIHHVLVAVVRHHVNPPVLPPLRVLAEPHRAIRQTLPVRPPLRITPPAVVNRVARPAPAQPSPCVILATLSKPPMSNNFYIHHSQNRSTKLKTSLQNTFQARLRVPSQPSIAAWRV
jgi:hypothetical protein